MSGSTACRLCGRGFAPDRGGMRYCPPCRKRASKEAARVLRVGCAGCGATFSTPSRVVRYCEPCRKKNARRRSGRKAARPRRGGGAKATAACRACSKEFEYAKRGPGSPVAYCSDACRAERKLALCREAMRRYRADPEKLAVQTMRQNAVRARRRAGKKGAR